MSQTQQSEQTTANIDRIRVFYAKIKRDEYLARIFEDSDKAKELDFDLDQIRSMFIGETFRIRLEADGTGWFDEGRLDGKKAECRWSEESSQSANVRVFGSDAMDNMGLTIQSDGKMKAIADNHQRYLFRYDSPRD